jgi:uncharacterized protein
MAINFTGSYFQDFNTLVGSGTSSVLPTDWVIAETGANLNTTYTAGTGSATAGDSYSFGSAGSPDRALGSLQSGSLVPSFGVSFINKTGSVLTSLTVNYQGEQWRLGTTGRADRLDFQYSIDAGSLATGTWVDADALDFSSIVTAGTVGALDGNVNKATISSTISGLNLAPDSTIWFRWQDFNAAGADDGLGIDDITVSTTTTPVGPTVSIESTANAAEAGPANGNFRISRTGDNANSLTVNYSIGAGAGQATPGTDYTALTGTATIAAGSFFVDVAVAPVDDTLVEGPEEVTLTLAAPSGYGLGVATAKVTIVDNDAPAATITKIHDIQGTGTAAALTGLRTIEGVVVGAFNGATKLNGFYVQEEDADADANAATSEGIFVYDPTGQFTGAVGTKVRVTGTVAEFTGGVAGVAGPASTSLTQLTVSSNGIVNLGSVALPTVTNIVLPVVDDSVLERYEGMLVNISAATGPLTVTETFKLGRFGQVGLSAGGRLDQFTQTNAPSVAGYADYLNNLLDRYIILDDGSGAQNPDPEIFARGGNPLSAANTLRGGDTIGSISGVLDERFEGYRVQTTTPANFVATNPRPETAPVVGGTLKIATFNLLNYFNGDGSGGGFPTSRGADNAAEFARQRVKTIDAILDMNVDVLAYNEMENDGYGATSAIQDLVNGLNAIAGAGTYAFVTPPANQLIGGKLGGDEITVGFIYKQNAVRIAPGTTAASLQTGVFDQVNTRVQRAPLAVSFERISGGQGTGEVFTAVANHFKSKGSSAGGAGDADALDGQGLSNGTRTRASQQLAAWLDTKPTGTTDNDVIILGDLNAYRLEDPIQALIGAGYTSLFGPESYSYQFNGQWGSLDHALANSSLNGQVTGAVKFHINADEPIVFDYNTEFKTAGQISSFYGADAFRSSDHDPIVIGLNLTPTFNVITGTGRRDTLIGTSGNDQITGGVGGDRLTGGAGADQFIYTDIRDAGDTITDFAIGSDKLVLTQLLDSLVPTGYSGNAIADGYVRIVAAASGAMVQVDRNGTAAGETFRDYITVQGVTVAGLNNPSNFIF